jgi:hypothetical protein
MPRYGNLGDSQDEGYLYAAAVGIKVCNLSGPC